MQGQRSAIGSLPETLTFDHGSSSSDAGIDQQICWNNMRNSTQNRLSNYISPSSTSVAYLNPTNEEGQNLSGWTIGEQSSSSMRNQVLHHELKTEHGWSSSLNASAPILEERQYEQANILSLNDVHVNLSNDQNANGSLFLQTASSDSLPQDLNISSGFMEHVADDLSENVRLPSASTSSDPFGVSSGYLVEENEGRPGCLLEGRRLSCKRKAVEGNVGQSSGSGSSHYFQRGEGSVWHGVPARQNASSSLFISPPSENTIGVNSLEEDVNPRLGLGVGGVTSENPIVISAAGRAESSRRNLRSRINASHQQDSMPTNVFSTGNLPHHSSRLLPPNSLDLMSPPASDNAIPHVQPVAVHVPARRRNLQSSRWNRSSSPIPGSSTRVISGERDIGSHEESNLRPLPRSVSEHPMFVPAIGMRNSAQNPSNWSLTGGNLNVASSSRTGPSSGVHTASGPNWGPHRNHPHYPRRLSEFVRRSLAESGGQSSNFTPPHLGAPASSQETALSSGDQGQHLSHSRSGMLLDRQLEGAFGLPYSLRTLTAAGEGRSRLVSEQIRNVLDIMRRGEGLRFEDVMILDQSVFFGMADIHDRHRDMRLDVDNMSYEELLALEERIGNVNTGLSEETISNRLKVRKYICITTGQLEVEPCCICQEEYNNGQDLGTLECGHDFHTECITKWLLHKNLCPICKTTALVT